jgi:hypothetical protein
MKQRYSMPQRPNPYIICAARLERDMLGIDKMRILL